MPVTGKIRSKSVNLSRVGDRLSPAWAVFPASMGGICTCPANKWRERPAACRRPDTIRPAEPGASLGGGHTTWVELNGIAHKINGYGHIPFGTAAIGKVSATTLKAALVANCSHAKFQFLPVWNPHAGGEIRHYQVKQINDECAWHILINCMNTKRWFVRIRGWR